MLDIECQFIYFVLFFYFQATTKPVAVGFGISKPEHVKQVTSMSIFYYASSTSMWLFYNQSYALLQVAGWGADGVIVGSAMVKLLGEAKSPQEGLKELENFTRSLTSALP